MGPPGLGPCGRRGCCCAGAASSSSKTTSGGTKDVRGTTQDKAAAPAALRNAPGKTLVTLELPRKCANSHSHAPMYPIPVHPCACTLIRWFM